MSREINKTKWQKMAGILKENREYPTDERDFDLEGEPLDKAKEDKIDFEKSADFDDEIKNMSISDLIDRGYSAEEIMDFIKKTGGSKGLEEELDSKLFNKDEENGSKPLDPKDFEDKNDPEKVFADTEIENVDDVDPNDLAIIFGDKDKKETKKEESMVGHKGGPSREGHYMMQQEKLDDNSLEYLFNDPDEEDEEEVPYDDEDDYFSGDIDDELSGMYDVHTNDWKPKLDEGSEDRAGIIWHLRDKGMNDTDILENLILALSDEELYNALEEYLDDYEKTSLKEKKENFIKSSK